MRRLYSHTFAHDDRTSRTIELSSSTDSTGKVERHQQVLVRHDAAVHRRNAFWIQLQFLNPLNDLRGVFRTALGSPNLVAGRWVVAVSVQQDALLREIGNQLARVMSVARQVIQL